MTEESCVLVDRRGGVGVVTLNRPAKLNALNSQLTQELEAALKELDADDAIGAIVVTGAGDRAFSAGGDMKEQREQLASGTIRSRRSSSVALRTARKPTVAAIRGYAFGGGALLALAADIRIAGEDARFKFHGATYGQAPGGAALPRLVGVAKAKELLFTGDEVNAAEALRIGLVNQVVPTEQVVETAVGMAERIANNSRAAVSLLKETIELALPTEQDQAYEDQRNADIRGSGDSASRFRAAAARIVGPSA